MKNKDFSVVIPIYNEEKNLESFLKKLLNTLENSENINYEIICVNDGSTDNTNEILKEFQDKIKIVNLTINRGYGNAIKTGVENSKYDIIVTIDADGQHNPEDIFKLLNNYEHEYDLVIGARKLTDSYKKRIIGKFLIKKITNFIFENDIKDVNSGFRVFNKNTAKKLFFLCSDRFSFSTSLTLSYYAFSYNVKFVPISVEIRKEGKSYVNYISGLKTILKIFQIAMIFKPLRVIMPFLLFFSSLTIISLSIDLVKTNLSDSTVLLFSISVLIFIFGLLSEQIKNLRFEILELLTQEKKNEKI